MVRIVPRLVVLVCCWLALVGESRANPPSEQATTQPRPRVVVQLGHSDNLLAVAYSADGRLALTGSEDQTARLWDTTTGKEIRRFAGHDGPIRSVAFSVDARYVLTGSVDSTARLWETATASEVRRFAHPGVVTSTVFSPQGQLFATGCSDGKARSWDVATGQCTATFSGHTDGVRAVAFSPDGARLLTGSDDQTSCVWNAKSQELVFRLAGHTAPVTSVSFSPDGQMLLTGSFDATARTWDAQSGRQLRLLQLHRKVFSAAFSPDGRQIVTGNEGFPFRGEEPAERHHTVRLWTTDTGQMVRSFRDSGSSAVSVAFAPSGQQVLVGAAGNTTFFGAIDGRSQIWDTATGTELRVFQGQGVAAVECLTFSADGRWLLMGGDDGIARLWDGGVGREIQRFQHPTGRILSVDISRDGRIVATGGSDNTVRLWDREQGTEIRRIDGHAGGVVSVALSPDLRLVLSGSADSSARLWDTSTGQERRRLVEYRGQTEFVSPLCSYVAFSPDGSQMLTGQWDNTARLWNTSDGRELRTFEGHENRVAAVAFSSDGKQVLTGSWDKSVRLWNVESGQELRAFNGHEGHVRSVAMAPGGGLALSASSDMTARVWNLTSGEELHSFAGHRATGQSVATSAGAGLMAMTNLDSTATLRDARTAREICTLVSCQGGCLVVMPDGHYMAPKGALQSVAFGLGNRALPFDQFDLKFNRPDLVLSQIGLAPSELVDSYEQLYKKRLRKLKFTEEMLGDGFHIPEISLVSNRADLTTRKSITIRVRATDSTRQLDRLLIDINGVPRDGAAGIPLRDKHVQTWEQDVEVELSSGRNTLQISVLNDQGAESLQEQWDVRCDAPRPLPDLYVVAVGVSDYVDPRYRLTYAHKDAADLAAYCQSQTQRFGKVHVELIQNRDATRENILKAKQLLEKSQVDDQVLLFFAGHGLLDAKRDYYFGAANIDFAQPTKNGLSYDDLEGLLAGIRARRKLLLIDTCHSGEADKDEVGTASSQEVPEGTVRARAVRDFQTLNESGLEPSQSRRMVEDLFADLRRGTGAVIISAAGSAEYALESAQWQNGVFTYAVLDGLKNGKADTNSDGRIRVSELRDYVQQEVRRLTRGRQSPITRKENIEVDFPLN